MSQMLLPINLMNPCWITVCGKLLKCIGSSNYTQGQWRREARAPQYVFQSWDKSTLKCRSDTDLKPFIYITSIWIAFILRKKNISLICISWKKSVTVMSPWLTESKRERECDIYGGGERQREGRRRGICRQTGPSAQRERRGREHSRLLNNTGCGLWRRGWGTRFFPSKTHAWSINSFSSGLKTSQTVNPRLAICNDTYINVTLWLCERVACNSAFWIERLFVYFFSVVIKQGLVY